MSPGIFTLLNSQQDLENFEPSAFIPDDRVSSSLCGFMLVAAVFFNDLKDIVSGDYYLSQIKPQGSYARTKEWGAYHGIESHLMRLAVGSVHEFLKVIGGDCRKVFDEDFYHNVYKQLSKSEKRCWNAVLNIGLDRAGTQAPLTKILLLVRNQMSFHYSNKALLDGYRVAFFDSGKVLQNAVISRGSSMESSRFYFADATMQTKFYVEAEKILGSQFKQEFMSFLRDINDSVFSLVDKFILLRTQYMKGA